MVTRDVLGLFGTNTFKINPSETECVNSIYQMSDIRKQYNMP